MGLIVLTTGFTGMGFLAGATGVCDACLAIGFAAPWAGLAAGRGLDATDFGATGFWADFGATDFFAGIGVGFLTGAAFLATGLATLLEGGVFLTALLPDECAGLAAAFLAGALFFAGVAFLAAFAAFFLVAILLGFFSNKHF
jgi:hypothetical protein